MNYTRRTEVDALEAADYSPATDAVVGQGGGDHGRRRGNRHHGVSGAVVMQARSLKRDAFPDDVEGTVVILASDDSAFMSGQPLVIDGGSVFSTL